MTLVELCEEQENSKTHHPAPLGGEAESHTDLGLLNGTVRYKNAGHRPDAPRPWGVGGPAFSSLLPRSACLALAAVNVPLAWTMFLNQTAQRSQSSAFQAVRGQGQPSFLKLLG